MIAPFCGQEGGDAETDRLEPDVVKTMMQLVFQKRHPAVLGWKNKAVARVKKEMREEKKTNLLRRRGTFFAEKCL